MTPSRACLALGLLLLLLSGCDEQPRRQACGGEASPSCQSGDASPGQPTHADGAIAVGVDTGAGADLATAADGGPVGTSIAPPARILCLGDSITAQAESWIYPLQDLMRQDGCAYQLIGHDHEPYDGPYQTKSGYDDLRIAVGGFSSTGVLNWIKEQGMGGTPDIIIAYLGVNNVYGGYIDGKYNPDVTDDPAGAFVKDMGAILAIARGQNPQVTMILSKIQNNDLPQISGAIGQVVATQHTAASPVLPAESATGVETKDGIHPTSAGAAALAAEIYLVLGPVLKSHGLCQ